MPGAGQPTPKPLLDKLGVKPGARVSIVGLREDGFLALLRSRTGEITTGRAKRGSDLIFVFVAHREELDARVAPLRDHLKPDGAIWVVRPKGIPDMKEVDVIDAGKRAGLVDNKIASFSESLSAMRLVIPLALRWRGESPVHPPDAGEPYNEASVRPGGRRDPDATVVGRPAEHSHLVQPALGSGPELPHARRPRSASDPFAVG